MGNGLRDDCDGDAVVAVDGCGVECDAVAVVRLRAFWNHVGIGAVSVNRDNPFSTCRVEQKTRVYPTRNKVLMTSGRRGLIK